MTGTRPLISLAMTAWNPNPHYLADAIDSLLAQTFEDWELVFVDDGSTRPLLPKMIHAAKQDSRIVPISAGHQGRAKALSFALSMCSGQYLGWLDADDMLHPRCLELCAEGIEGAPERPDAVFTGYKEIDPGGHEMEQRYPHPWFEGGVPVSPHLALISRERYEAVLGIDESYECGMDMDLIFRAVQHREDSRFSYVSRPLYYYRRHNDTISRRQKAKQRECGRRAVEEAKARQIAIPVRT